MAVETLDAGNDYRFTSNTNITSVLNLPIACNVADPLPSLSVTVDCASKNDVTGLVVEMDDEQDVVAIVSSDDSTTVLGGDGDDTLSLNLSNLDAIPANGLIYDGQAGAGDKLEFFRGITPNSFDSVTHSFAAGGAGNVSLSIGAATRSMMSASIEVVTDDLVVASRHFLFNGGSETITLSDVADVGQLRMRIDSSLTASVDFSLPMSALNIIAGTGDDQINVSSIEIDFRAPLAILGDSGVDSISVTPHLTIGSGSITGNINLSAESIAIAGDIDTTAGDIDGPQTFAGDVSLGATANFTASVANFLGTINGAGRSLHVTGNAVFGDGADDTVTGLSQLLVTGATTVGTTTVASTGSQTYQGTLNVALASGTATFTTAGSPIAISGATTLNANATFTAGAANVTFTGTVDGSNALAVNSSGVTSLLAPVGAGTPLASLTTDAAGSTLLQAGAVSTTGQQNYSDNVTLGVDTTLTASTATFLGTVGVNGASRILNVTGNAVFGDGADDIVTGLSQLLVTGATTVRTTTVASTGSQTYQGTLNVALASGTATFTTAGSPIAISGATTLNANATFTAGAANVTFTGTVDGGNALAVNSSGVTSLLAPVGTGTPLASLTTDAAGSTLLQAGAVSTTGQQNYSDNVTLGVNTTLTASTATFLGTVGVNGASRILNVTGNAVFGDDADDTVTGLSQLLVTGATTVRTTTVASTGSQTYQGTLNVALASGMATFTTTDSPIAISGATTLNANATFTAGAENVTFTGIVDGGNALAVNSSGVTSFLASVGAGTPLASLTTDAAGSTVLQGGAVSTTGQQNYEDNLTLGVNTTLTASTAIFLGTVGANGASRSLHVTGNAVFGDGADDTVTGLSQLLVTGATAVRTTMVASTGSQTYQGTLNVALASGTATFTTAGSPIAISGATTLSANATFTAGLGNATFAGTVDGGNALAVNSSGVTSFLASVGAGTPLASLTTDAAGSTLLQAGAVSTTGQQNYSDNVTLGVNTTLTASTATFLGTVGVNGASRSLHVTGNAVFGDGADDTVTGLSQLLVTGATTVGTTTVASTGSQTYQGTLNVALASGTATFTTTDSPIAISGATTLNANATFTAGAANVTFTGTVDGDTALAVNSSGVSSFLAPVGAGTPLASLTTDAAGTTRLAGNLTTQGSQSYNDPVRIDVDLEITTTDANVSFAQTVTSESAEKNDLFLNVAAGDIAFLGAVGTNSDDILGSLSVGSARDLTFSSTVTTSDALSQATGTGNTRFNGTSGDGIGGSLTVSTNSIQFNMAGVATVGDVTLTALNTIQISTGSGLSSNLGRIHLRANQDGSGAEGFTQASGTSIATDNNQTDAVDIRVNTPSGGTGGAALATITVNSATGRVTVNTTAAAASGGSITDSNGPAMNITAFAAAMAASGGIGTLDTIETAVSLIASSNTASGSIRIANSAGGLLTVGTVGSLAGISNTGGDVELANGSPVTLADDIGSSGAVSLTAQDSPNPGDDLVVNASDSAGNGAVDIIAVGSVALRAGDNLAVASSANIMAGGLATFLGDFDNQDAAPGAIIDLGGVINVSGGGSPAIQVAGGSGNDSLNLTGAYSATLSPPATGPAMIVNTGEGQNTVLVRSAGSLELMEVRGGAGIDSFTLEANQSPVTLFGGGGDDIFRVASSPVAGNLDSIRASVSIDGQTGVNTLLIDDSTSTTANNGVVIEPAFVRGFAGPADTTPIGFANIASLTVNSNASSDRFRVGLAGSGDAGPAVGTLTINLGGGNDAIDIWALAAGSSATIHGDDGRDLMAVSGAGAGSSLALLGDADNDYLAVGWRLEGGVATGLTVLGGLSLQVDGGGHESTPQRRVSGVGTNSNFSDLRGGPLASELPYSARTIFVAPKPGFNPVGDRLEVIDNLNVNGVFLITPSAVSRTVPSAFVASYDKFELLEVVAGSGNDAVDVAVSAAKALPSVVLIDGGGGGDDCVRIQGAAGENPNLVVSNAREIAADPPSVNSQSGPTLPTSDNLRSPFELRNVERSQVNGQAQRDYIYNLSTVRMLLNGAGGNDVLCSEPGNKDLIVGGSGVDYVCSLGAGGTTLLPDASVKADNSGLEDVIADGEVLVLGTPDLGVSLGADFAVGRNGCGNLILLGPSSIDVICWLEGRFQSPEGGGTLAPSNGAYNNLFLAITQPVKVMAMTVGLSVTALSVLEQGGSAGFDVVLEGPPETDVRVTIEPTDPSEVRVRSTELIFTKTNWSQPRTVLIEGVNDTDADGDILSAVNIAIDTSRSDPSFANAPRKQVAVRTLDDDVPSPAFERRFDFGTTISAVETGYTRVSERSSYSRTAGFGWTAGAPKSTVRGTGNALDQDLILANRATFVVDVPNGTYRASVRIGDTSTTAHDQMAVAFENVRAEVISTAAKQLIWKDYTFVVSDGQLTFDLNDLGGADPNVAIAALRILRVAPDSIPPAALLRTASTQPTVVDPATFILAFNEPVVGLDASDLLVFWEGAGTPRIAVAGSGANYTITVAGLKSSGKLGLRLPAAAVVDLTGNSNAASDLFVADYLFTRRYDFGTSTSPVATGYSRATTANRYTPAAGFGWASGTVADIDRRAGDNMTRDIAVTTDATFVADVVNGYYDVTVVLGDRAAARDTMGVYLENALQENLSTAAGAFATRTYRVAVDDGQLTLRLKDNGGRDRNVAIASLAIAGVPPTAASSLGTMGAAGEAPAEIARATPTHVSHAQGSRSRTVQTPMPQSEDVDRDGVVTPRDALLIANWLHGHRSDLTALGATISRLDVNSDGLVTPADALHVINRLASIAPATSNVVAPAAPPILSRDAIDAAFDTHAMNDAGLDENLLDAIAFDVTRRNR